MSVTTTQYIRKPLYVDAVRVTNANFDEIAAWCQGEVQQDEVPEKGAGKKYIRVRVHNPKNPRQTKAFVGDWILYTERGYKVYTNKAFHASFDAVESNGGVVMGSEEIIPGLTLNEIIEMLRDGRLIIAKNRNDKTVLEEDTEAGEVRELANDTKGKAL
jgi:hypothetical protein